MREGRDMRGVILAGEAVHVCTPSQTGRARNSSTPEGLRRLRLRRRVIPVGGLVLDTPLGVCAPRDGTVGATPRSSPSTSRGIGPMGTWPKSSPPARRPRIPGIVTTELDFYPCRDQNIVDGVQGGMSFGQPSSAMAPAQILLPNLLTSSSPP